MIGTFETENAPELYALDDPRVWDETAEIRPDSLYGVSKVYGEAMARYYVDHHGLKAFCLRIGELGLRMIQPTQTTCGGRNSTTIPRSWRAGSGCARSGSASAIACTCSIAAWPRTVTGAAHGISDNPRRFWDIEHAKKVLVYQPQDAAPAEIVPDRG